jgi:hypothetical protein
MSIIDLPPALKLMQDAIDEFKELDKKYKTTCLFLNGISLSAIYEHCLINNILNKDESKEKLWLHIQWSLLERKITLFFGKHKEFAVRGKSRNVIATPTKEDWRLALMLDSTDEKYLNPPEKPFEL